MQIVYVSLRGQMSASGASEVQWGRRQWHSVDCWHGVSRLLEDKKTNKKSVIYISEWFCHQVDFKVRKNKTLCSLSCLHKNEEMFQGALL